MKILAGILICVMLWGSTAQALDINMHVIAKIESNNDPNAVSGKGAYGMYQITQVCLDDYNVAHRTTWDVSDMFRPGLCYKVAVWYMEVRIPQMLRAFNMPITEESVIISYNWGVGSFTRWYRKGGDKTKLPSETRRYLIKYGVYTKVKGD